MADFGSAPESNAASSRKGKQAESYGIITTGLPNGLRVDGYTLLTLKNAAKLGIPADKLAELCKKNARAVIGEEGGVQLFIQFGDREVTVAAPVEMSFV